MSCGFILQLQKNMRNFGIQNNSISEIYICNFVLKDSVFWLVNFYAIILTN